MSHPAIHGARWVFNYLDFVFFKFNIILMTFNSVKDSPEYQTSIEIHVKKQSVVQTLIWMDTIFNNFAVGCFICYESAFSVHVKGKFILGVCMELQWTLPNTKCSKLFGVNTSVSPCANDLIYRCVECENVGVSLSLDIRRHTLTARWIQWAAMCMFLLSSKRHIVVSFT